MVVQEVETQVHLQQGLQQLKQQQIHHQQLLATTRQTMTQQLVNETY
jgi:hypothetical protein